MKNVEVILPRLIEAEDVYYVEYSCFNERTDKLQRFRIYKGFRKRKTEAEKQAHGKTIIDFYSKKLRGGWRPWDVEKYIYKDEIEYKTVTAGFGTRKFDDSHLRKHSSAFLLMRKRETSPKTYQSYNSKIRVFIQWLEISGHKKIKIYEITQKIVIQFFNYLIDKRKLDRITINKYQQNLGQMFKYFLKLKLIDVIPMDGIPRPPKTKDMAARPIIESDLRDLLEYFSVNDEQMFLACLMQFFLCCRPGRELRLMKCQDVDLSNKQVYITEETAKKSKRIITMPDALVEVCVNFNLHKYPHDFYVFGQNGKPGKKPVGQNTLTNHFNLGRTKFNLPLTYKFYSLKHTGAGKILESGATLAELMNHLGHTSFESTIRYVHRHFGERSEKITNFKPAFMNGLIK